MLWARLTQPFRRELVVSKRFVTFGTVCPAPANASARPGIRPGTYVAKGETPSQCRVLCGS